MRILNTYPVYEASFLLIALFAISIFVFLLSAGFSKIIPMIVSLFAILACMILPAISVQTFTNSTNRYECLIDDDYSVKDLYDKYEVIEIK